MAHPFGERPKRQPDVFTSPHDPSYEYVVQGPETDDNIVDTTVFTRVTALTPDGATSYSPDQVEADKLKRRPRLGKTGREIVVAANFEWSLAESERGAARG